MALLVGDAGSSNLKVRVLDAVVVAVAVVAVREGLEIAKRVRTVLRRCS